MSSQAIATSSRGLPDLPSWTAASNLHPNDSDSNHEDEREQEHHHISPSVPSHATWDGLDVQTRNHAVGNLLAALTPLGQTQPPAPQTATAPVRTDMAPLPVPSLDGSPEAPATEMNNINLETDPENLLPPLPLQIPEDFLATGGLPPLPPTLPMDSFTQPLPLPVGPDGLLTTHASEPQPLAAPPIPLAERREIEAFAKIEFEDGNYYITTYACELGRDAFAYRAALAKDEEARQAEQDRAQSSSGRRSGLSGGIPRPGDSQVQGSVVSEAGGFGGVDDGLGMENEKGEDGHPLHSHSSERSAGSVVKPQEVLYNPPLAPFDYHRMAERQAQLEYGNEQEPDNEQPAPVTADHIPDAHNCPLIPIHAMRNHQKSELENHKSISRRHVKIQWDFDKERFQMKVMGRNGAFLDDVYLQRGQTRPLRDGSKIQISNVWMTFKLPKQEPESASDGSGREAAEQSPSRPRSTSPTSNEQDRSVSPPKPGRGKTKIILNTIEKSAPPSAEPILGPDGQPLPPKRRGPGRPPKDGIMSTRERKEREKAAKLAEAKAANGGKTPPPMMRGPKPPRPTPIEEEPVAEPKAEKRKYKKRKRIGEDGDIVQSIEGGEVDVPSEPEKAPPVKKARSKSPSPDYPPVESLTEEQLARPSEPYARLIYDILLDIHPKALPLKQIYRALKLKFPFFVHRVDSEGWQSSVRHNLNQEWNKLFEKGEKEGKGFAWKAIPGALQPQAERRRAAQQAAASKPKPTPAPRQNAPQGPPQMLNWQNSTPYPQQNGMPPQGHPPPFYGQGPHGSMPPPSNGMPWPPPPGGMPPSASAYPAGQNRPFYPPAQAGQSPFPPQHPPAPAHSGHPTSQGSHPPPSTTTTPAPASAVPIPTSSSASRNMPCTLDGLITIKKFESAMLEQVHPARIEHWQKIFASATRRLLHGHPESLVPGGHTIEEETIMGHIRDFIRRFKNPNFAGFSRTGSPAPAASSVNMGTARNVTPHTAVPATTTPGPPQPAPSGLVKSNPQVQAAQSGPSAPSASKEVEGTEPSTSTSTSSADSKPIT
ncbi:uncharacterized protein Z520_00968 [Fonsecaea multimorphosa CBS 102226]|uniref:Fork-head domain-containing protein n=1 Tax=Fonsecaea multimorphosa CBS 102226 TaxID=1442371 RepID=A0A0D2K8V9_9EURO|nr:uncharacterized protein Z520_00968 [Fonsecaea multimorphosa CBS 102226]KIY02503.1 hypothetical protein Z520_00968 [Fonsecaea multimorphosa CBS 102226]OAL31370.1 hypothetical protein AYO22_00962 [Fonsecaea multimorphosa]